MSYASTMQFLRTGTSSGCGPLPGYAGDLVGGLGERYPAARPRAPWDGGRRGIAGAADAIRLKRGEVYRTGAAGFAKVGSIPQTRR